MEDLEQNDVFGGIADVLAKYLYTQRFYDAEGNVRFTDESRMNGFYDYGTGATGTRYASSVPIPASPLHQERSGLNRLV